MKMNLSVVLALSTLIVSPVFAGLNEAIQAFNGADYQAAYPEFLALSEEGNAEANYYMGRIYKDGLGVTADSDKALRYFENADKSLNLDATVELAKMIIAGEGTKQNVNLGLQYLKKAAYAGSMEALYELGRMYEEGIGVELNLNYAFGFYYMGALKGDKRAQLKTAKYYLSGRGIVQDFAKAQKWYMRSANQGYIPAQQEWANILATHPRYLNPIDAYSWYSVLAAYNSDEIGQAAAEQRDKISMNFKSDILTVQQEKIMNWRPVPAELSVPAEERRNAVLPIIPGFNDDQTIKSRLDAGDALSLDGMVYGISVKMIENAVETGDKTLLERTVSIAGDNGQTKVYSYYGDLLKKRFGDSSAAVTWYQKGADLGESYAQYQLGKAYCEGNGVASPDPSLCYGWLLLASSTADRNLALTVKEALGSVETLATAEELEKGKAFYEQQVQKQNGQKKLKEEKKTNLFNLF
jgi:TPR repeat protein